MKADMSKNVPLAHSPIWDRIHAGPLANPAAIDLETFRSSGPLFAISMWDPNRYGLRYLKMLLFALLSVDGKRDTKLYRKISNRALGNPITVRVRGVDVCLDYFQAVDEAKTIAASGLPGEAARLVEIGPGYGRTCHALISLYPQIAEYWLVDLEPCLALAHRYLERVLDRNLFAKLRFVTASEFGEKGGAERFDLALNIDSFGDLPPEVAQAYLALIDARCDAFFCKNPIAKYLDPALGGEVATNERVQEALRSGLARDVIDIFDSEQVDAAVPKFLAAYRPGPDWRVIVERPAPPWSYYHQVVFHRQNSRKQFDDGPRPGGKDQ